MRYDLLMKKERGKKDWGILNIVEDCNLRQPAGYKQY